MSKEDPVIDQPPAPAPTQPKPKSNGCLGCFAVGVVIAIIVFVGVAVSTSGSHPSTSSHKASHSSKHTQAADTDFCALVFTDEKKSVDDLNAGAYQSAYNVTKAGLAAVPLCDNDNERLMGKAYLLSMKGLAEHHLPVGDAQTDLNQANQLLVECQTQPGLYGTHAGAGCETQEQSNVAQQTSWEMGE